MEPGGDADAHLSSLRASMQDRIHRSAKLIDGARRRDRTQRDAAGVMYGRAEEQFVRSLRQVRAQYEAVLGGDDPSRDDLVQAVLDVAGSIYPGCRAVSVTAVSDAGDPHGHGLRYTTVAHAGDAAIADAVQYAFDEGPCPEAIALDQVTVIGSDDLANDDPPVWPRFTAAARRLGIRSAVSIGIPWTTYWTGPSDPGRPSVGAINVYAYTPYGFLAKESAAISLGVHLGTRLTGADPAEIFDPASFGVDQE